MNAAELLKRIKARYARVGTLRDQFKTILQEALLR